MEYKKYKYVVGTFLLVAMFMITYTIFLPILPQTRVYPTYVPRDVQYFCHLLDIQNDGEDTFCSNYVGKNMEGLNAFLKQKFPVETAKYSDVKTYFKNLKSSWWSDCPNTSTNHNYDELVFNCPVPRNCKGQWYICRFVVNGSIIAIDVRFNISNGSVMDINAMNSVGS